MAADMIELGMETMDEVLEEIPQTMERGINHMNRTGKAEKRPRRQHQGRHRYRNGKSGRHKIMMSPHPTNIPTYHPTFFGESCKSLRVNTFVELHRTHKLLFSSLQTTAYHPNTQGSPRRTLEDTFPAFGCEKVRVKRLLGSGEIQTRKGKQGSLLLGRKDCRGNSLVILLSTK